MPHRNTTSTGLIRDVHAVLELAARGQGRTVTRRAIARGQLVAEALQVLEAFKIGEDRLNGDQAVVP